MVGEGHRGGGIVVVENGKAASGTKHAEGFRYSTGIALSWSSPIGPLKVSYGVPLNKKDGDRVENFQFQLGSVF